MLILRFLFFIANIKHNAIKIVKFIIKCNLQFNIVFLLHAVQLLINGTNILNNLLLK